MLTQLSEHLLLFKGRVNTGLICHTGQALAIDLGDAGVLDRLKYYGIKGIEGLLFTHHHRDIARGAYRVLRQGIWLGVPEAERALFEDVHSFWQNPQNRWHLYDFRSNYVLPEPLPVHRLFKDGEQFRWGPALITAICTPGHTEGSMSYLVEVDGKRFAFCGELLYDKGKVSEIYSLQKGFGGLTDYHGFMFAWREVIESLKKLISFQPHILIPSKGNIIFEPEEAVRLLEDRLRQCYESYLSTSALWYYFPQLLSQQTSQRPVISAELLPVPSYLLHIGTSWIILSEDRRAFVMDCGSEDVINQLQELVMQGEIRGVEGLWLTHTHDDHTDAVAKFRQRFACEVIAEESVAQVVANPSAWKLPCLSPNPAPIDRVIQSGTRWSWREFDLTAYHFPGQSLYHSGLLVEGKGLKLFFAGDSLTPTGLDDYCAFNRNFLAENRGYDFCLQLLEKLEPDLIFNCHIDKPFRFDRAQLQLLRKELERRRQIFKELFPWEDPNYGIDPYWLFFLPYEQEVKRGHKAEGKVIVINHLTRPASFRIRAILPPSWSMGRGFLQLRCELQPGEERHLPFSMLLPFDIPPGRHIIHLEGDLDGNPLPSPAEFVLIVSE